MTEVTPRGKQTKLSTNTKQAKEWLGDLPDVENIFQLKSYDELSKIVNDWLAGDEEDTGTEKFEKTKSSKSEESSTYSNLDDAFADLM